MDYTSNAYRQAWEDTQELFKDPKSHPASTYLRNQYIDYGGEMESGHQSSLDLQKQQRWVQLSPYLVSGLTNEILCSSKQYKRNKACRPTVAVAGYGPKTVRQLLQGQFHEASTVQDWLNETAKDSTEHDKTWHENWLKLRLLTRMSFMKDALEQNVTMYWDKARFKIKGEKVKDFIEEYMNKGPEEFISFLKENDEEVAEAFTEIQYDDDEMMEKVFNEEGNVVIDEEGIDIPEEDSPYDDDPEPKTQNPIEYVNGRPNMFKSQVMLTKYNNPVSRMPTVDERANEGKNADDNDYTWNDDRQKWLLLPDASEVEVMDTGVGNIVNELVKYDQYADMQTKMDELNNDFGSQFSVDKWEEFKTKALERGFKKDEIEFVGDWGGTLRFQDTKDDIPKEIFYIPTGS